MDPGIGAELEESTLHGAVKVPTLRNAAKAPGENVDVDELGDLELTPGEEQAIVAFLKTLSDGRTGR